MSFSKSPLLMVYENLAWQLQRNHIMADDHERNVEKAYLEDSSYLEWFKEGQRVHHEQFVELTYMISNVYALLSEEEQQAVMIERLKA